MSKATNRVCKKALIQIYIDHCCGCRGGEICHQIVSTIIAGFSAKHEGFLLMQVVSNCVLTF